MDFFFFKFCSFVYQVRNIRYMTVDEESMSFDRASVDLIISSLSLHWTNDLPKTLKEVNYV